jgi:hypothetical protein
MRLPAWQQVGAKRKMIAYLSFTFGIKRVHNSTYIPKLRGELDMI